MSTRASAARYARALLDVVIVEEGPHVSTEELRSDMYTSTKRVWRDMGFQAARGRAISSLRSKLGQPL